VRWFFAVSLGKTTTAEGVETKEQLDILRAEDCDEMQGYYFSRPKHASEVVPLMLRQFEISASAA
jgi:EAL domain-containing protein (putative c-di-GMP-specific phosphodiesterase class I)